MITVMFSSGVRVTYNDANDVTFEANRIDICFKDGQGKRFYRVQWTNNGSLQYPKRCYPR